MASPKVNQQRRTTWRAVLEERLALNGETWGDVEAVTHSDAVLDREWAYGFGELKDPPGIVAWTAHRIYYTFMHSGFGDAASLPSHPTAGGEDAKEARGVSLGDTAVAPGARRTAVLQGGVHGSPARGTARRPEPRDSVDDKSEDHADASVPVVAVSMTTTQGREIRGYGQSAGLASETRCPVAGDRVLVEWGSGTRSAPATVVRIRPTGTLVLLIDAPAPSPEVTL